MVTFSLLFALAREQICQSQINGVVLKGDIDASILDGVKIVQI
jgi:hypothetical protein